MTRTCTLRPGRTCSRSRPAGARRTSAGTGRRSPARRRHPSPRCPFRSRHRPSAPARHVAMPRTARSTPGPARTRPRPPSPSPRPRAVRRTKTRARRRTQIRTRIRPSRASLVSRIAPRSADADSIGARHLSPLAPAADLRTGPARTQPHHRYALAAHGLPASARHAAMGRSARRDQGPSRHAGAWLTLQVYAIAHYAEMIREPSFRRGLDEVAAGRWEGAGEVLHELMVSLAPDASRA